VNATVAVTAPLPGRAEEILAARHELRVNRGPRLVDEHDLAAFIGSSEAAVTLLDNPITEAVLAACPELRIVANVAAGFDNIDLGAAEERGLWVTNTPEVLTEATADLAWALILGLTRRLRSYEGAAIRPAGSQSSVISYQSGIRGAANDKLRTDDRSLLGGSIGALIE
jgi:glyoxylate reductase